MGGYKTVVVGTDGSASSLRAVERAGALASGADAKLIVASAYLPGPEDTRAADVLKDEGYKMAGTAPIYDTLHEARDRAKAAGATNIEEAFLYSTNIETSLEYTDAQGSDNAGVSDLRNNNRIRGLGAASSLRGLFQTNIQPDLYNTERLTIASGANAILFGLANAGGSFDSTPQGSAFRNSRSLTLSTDDVGSRRA